MNIVVIYPGRFQPFGQHHLKAYKFLTSMFGHTNVYVVSSNKIDPVESPFSFNEKLWFMQNFIPMNRIVMVKNPYKAEELLENFDLENTIVIFAYSSKDANRISYNKKDGSPGYLQPYVNGNKLNPASVNGYIFILPEFNIKYKGKNLSGTYCRELLRKFASDLQSIEFQKEFKRIFGFFNKTLYFKILNKFK